MTPQAPAAPEAAAADPAELERLGISRIATENFLVGSYLHSRLADAIAEARRRRPAGNDA